MTAPGFMTFVVAIKQISMGDFFVRNQKFLQAEHPKCNHITIVGMGWGLAVGTLNPGCK